MTKFPRYEEIENPQWNKETLKKNHLYFLKISHGLLCLYLLIHSLLIPLVNNLMNGRPWYNEVEFWFILQLPIVYFLYIHKNLSTLNYSLIIVLMGSLLRIILEFFYLHTISWKLFSLFLSETSNLVFIYLAWDKTKKTLPLPTFFLSLCIGVIVGYFIKSHFEKKSKDNTITINKFDQKSSEKNSAKNLKNAIRFFYPDILKQLKKTETIIFSNNQNQLKNQFYLIKKSRLILKNEQNFPLRLKISALKIHLKSFDKIFFAVIIIKAHENYTWNFTKRVKSPFWIIENINSSSWERKIVFSEINNEKPNQLFGNWLITQKEILYEGNSR